MLPLPTKPCQSHFSYSFSSQRKQPGVNDCVADDQFNACKAQLDAWWDDSMSQLRRDLTASTATWKIVHNHYLMKYFTPPQQEELTTIMKEGGAHIFIGGHEHAEGHDYTDGIHQLENGPPPRTLFFRPDFFLCSGLCAFANFGGER